MSERFLLEDSSGVLLLENESDYYSQDYRVVTANDNLVLIESNNIVLNLVRTISDTLGLTEVTNKFTGIFKNIAETLGILHSSVVAPPSISEYELEDGTGTLYLEDESGNYIQDLLFQNVIETLGLVETNNIALNLVINVNETIGFTEVTNKIRAFFQNITETLGITDSSVIASPSLFEYELEDGSGTLYLEDGTGNYVQDLLLVNVIETLGLNESVNRLGTIIRNVNETIGLSEVSEQTRVFAKVVDETIGLTETRLTETTTLNYLLEGDNAEHYQLEDGSGGYQIEIPVYVINETVGLIENNNIAKTLLRNISETLIFTDTAEYFKGFFKVVTESIISLEEIIVNKLTDVNVYLIEDGSGRYSTEDGLSLYELDQLQLLHFGNDVLGLVESVQKVPGILQNILDQLNLVESFNTLQNMVRVIETEIIELLETPNRLMNILKNIATETIDLSELTNKISVKIRNILETIDLSESNNIFRGLVKNLSNSIILTEIKESFKGIVKVATSDILGFTDLVNRIRQVFISNNFGLFTATKAINLDSFTALQGINVNDMTVIYSYNFGDFIIIDDN